MNHICNLVVELDMKFHAQLGWDVFQVCPLLFHSLFPAKYNNAKPPPNPPAIAMARGPAITKEGESLFINRSKSSKIYLLLNTPSYSLINCAKNQILIFSFS